MMFAAGWLLVFTIFSGVTIMELGARPIEHFSIAPLQTCSAICSPRVLVRGILAQRNSACKPVRNVTFEVRFTPRAR